MCLSSHTRELNIWAWAWYRRNPTSIAPDISNSSISDVICESLNRDECSRWRACCEAARECCIAQQGMTQGTPPGHCARTWDGYSCWPDTPPNVRATTKCAPYIEHSIQTRKAIKTCTVNGTWFTKMKNEWTDYTPCLDKQGYVVGVYISLTCNVISITFLIPSMLIFCAFRDLMKQHRVRLHVNFFLSLLLSGVSSVLWFMLVHHDTLVNPVSSQTAMYRNPVWCRCLSFFKIYLTSTTYFWMFCEGYYLHRLLSRAFEPPKSLKWLYLLGWGVPIIPSLAYSLIRLSVGNESCWARSIGGYQWIIYGPNFLCLFINTIFLFNILRILLFQMHSHAHEPSNFRRGLKAALMLVPLFGLQLFLTIYRPPPQAIGAQFYEYTSYVINNSQGVFVSLIFCFFNGEVVNQMKHRCPCCRRYYAKKRKENAPVTSMTQVPSMYEAPAETPEPRCTAGDNEYELVDYSTNGQIIGPESPEKTKGYIALVENGQEY